jgi:hypothetical protein
MTGILRPWLFILLAGAMAGCGMFQPPANLDVRLTRPSEQALYLVSMRPLVESPGINTIHAWEIGVTTPAGVPVSDAHIAFSGGMPQHGHGFPTKPRVTGYLGAGRYRLDGVKFSMSGWWEMKLKLESAAGSDQVVFNTIAAPAGVR